MDEFAEFKYNDYGDSNDNLKWDFDESVLKNVKAIDGYNYLVNNNENVKKLIQVRNKVNKVCGHIHNNIRTFPQEAQDGLRLFVSIHGELSTNNTEVLDPFRNRWIQNNGVTSRVLYGEIPKGTMFNGLNKPKQRHVNKRAPVIGKDKYLRSKYRHLFFKIPSRNQNIENNTEFKDLVVHELAHTAANHQRWRNDDHGYDFNLYESIIKNVWDKV